MPETARKRKTGARTAPPADPPITGKVWRFIDYAGRWGGGLEGLKMQVPKYLKWYINGWTGAEGEVINAINSLRADPDFIWLQGALVELLSRATNTEPQYQGYILTSRHKPATATHVGRMLRVDKRGANGTARGVLTKLARAGFLEYVELEASISPQPTKERKPRGIGSGRIGRAQKGGKRPKNGAKSRNRRERLLKGEGEILLTQDKENRNAPESNDMRRVRLIDQVKKMQANGAAADTRRVRLIDQVKKMQANETATPTADGRAVLPPAAAPPTSSTSSDGPERAGNQPRRRMPARPSIQRLGQVTTLAAHRYNPAAWSFADDLLLRSGCIGLDRVEAVRRGECKYTPEHECERAHWAKAYDKVVSELGAESLDFLQPAINRRADALRARRGSYQKPEAYLMRAWYNLVCDLKRKGKALA